MPDLFSGASSQCAPGRLPSLEVWIYTFLGPENHAAYCESDQMGERLAGAGLVLFAVDLSGCPYAMDLVSGECFQLGFEAMYDDSIRDREAFVEGSDACWTSPIAFLADIEQRLIAQIAEEREADAAFLKAAAGDPAAVDENGRWLLHRRVEDGDLDGITVEIDRGAPLGKPDEHTDSPVEWAVLWGQAAALQLLLERAAPATPAAIVEAAESMEYGCLDVLLDAGVDPRGIDAETLAELREDPEVATRLDRVRPH